MIRALAETVGEGFAYIIVVAVAVFALSAIGYGVYAVFGPRNMAVQNAIFHNSQQYQDGMANRLQQYRLAYVQATTPAAKDAIRSMVQHDFASYDASKLTPDLQQFLQQMKGY